MSYSDYKKSYSYLRKCIRDNDTRTVMQFSRFRFGNRPGRRNNVAIWNVKTDNVVVMINHRGNVFVRSNSIFADHLSGSVRGAVKTDNMEQFRRRCSSYLRNLFRLNYTVEKAKQIIMSNPAKPYTINIGEPNIRGDVLSNLMDIARRNGDPDLLLSIRERYESAVATGNLTITNMDVAQPTITINPYEQQQYYVQGSTVTYFNPTTDSMAFGDYVTSNTVNPSTSPPLTVAGVEIEELDSILRD